MRLSATSLSLFSLLASHFVVVQGHGLRLSATGLKSEQLPDESDGGGSRKLQPPTQCPCFENSFFGDPIDECRIDDDGNTAYVSLNNGDSFVVIRPANFNICQYGTNSVGGISQEEFDACFNLLEAVCGGEFTSSTQSPTPGPTPVPTPGPTPVPTPGSSDEEEACPCWDQTELEEIIDKVEFCGDTPTDGLASQLETNSISYCAGYCLPDEEIPTTRVCGWVDTSGPAEPTIIEVTEEQDQVCRDIIRNTTDSAANNDLLFNCMWVN